MATLAISANATPDWLERLDLALQAITSAAHTVRVAAVRERAVVKFYIGLRRLNQHVAELEPAMHDGTRQVQAGTLALSEPDEGFDAATVIGKLELGYRILNGIYVLAGLAGLKRKALTRVELGKLGKSCEVLLDYITWCKDGVSEEVRAHAEVSFAEGMRELESGETVAFL